MSEDQLSGPPKNEDNVIHVDFGGNPGDVSEGDMGQEGYESRPPADETTQRQAAKGRHPASGGTEHKAGVVPAEVQQRHPRPDQTPPSITK